MVVEELASRFRLRLRRKWRISSRYCRHSYRGSDVICVKPRVYMNHSGVAALASVHTFGVAVERLLVVVDDVNLPLGTLRFKRKGSDGGHNGLSSVIEALGTEDFTRCRIGIGGGHEDELADYVLDEFSEDEEIVLREVISAAADGVLDFIENGIDSAMDRYNSFAIDPTKDDQ